MNDWILWLVVLSNVALALALWGHERKVTAERLAEIEERLQLQWRLDLLEDDLYGPDDDHDDPDGGEPIPEGANVVALRRVA